MSIADRILTHIAAIIIHLNDDTYAIVPLTDVLAFAVRFRESRSLRTAFIPGRCAANGRTLEMRSVQRVPDSPWSDAPMCLCKISQRFGLFENNRYTVCTIPKNVTASEHTEAESCPTKLRESHVQGVKMHIS